MHLPRFDIAMVEAARAGDRQAIVSLLAIAQPDIRRYARRSCSSADHIDDVVQETLWLLYRRVGTLRALSSVSAWLLAIVRRECLRLAARVTGSRVDIDEALLDPANEARLARRSQDDLRIDISCAIESLPAHYRDVVILRDIEEMTVDEIAATLALSREAVKGRLHRARALLREYLID